jgi:hypothetical protein
VLLTEGGVPIIAGLSFGGEIGRGRLGASFVSLSSNTRSSSRSFVSDTKRTGLLFVCVAVAAAALAVLVLVLVLVLVVVSG